MKMSSCKNQGKLDFINSPVEDRIPTQSKLFANSFSTHIYIHGSKIWIYIKMGVSVTNQAYTTATKIYCFRSYFQNYVLLATKYLFMQHYTSWEKSYFLINIVYI